MAGAVAVLIDLALCPGAGVARQVGVRVDVRAETADLAQILQVLDVLLVVGLATRP